MGKCVADRNAKAFALTLLYAFIFGSANEGAVVTFALSAKGERRVLPLIVSLWLCSALGSSS